MTDAAPHATRFTAQHTEATGAHGERFTADRLVIEEVVAPPPPPPAAVDEEDDAGPGTLPPHALTAVAEEEDAPTQAEPSVGTARRPRSRGRRAAQPPLAQPPPGEVDEEAVPGGAPPLTGVSKEAFQTPADALAGEEEQAAAAAPLPRVQPASLPPPPESEGEAATPAPGGGGRASTRAAAAAAASARPAKKTKAAPAMSTPAKAGGGGAPAPKKKAARSRRGVPRTGPPVRDAADSFGRAIHATLHMVATSEGLTLSKGAVTILNDMLLDVRGRLAGEAARLARVRKAATLTARDVQAAVRLVFPGDLAKHAVLEGTKAVTKATGGGV